MWHSRRLSLGVIVPLVALLGLLLLSQLGSGTGPQPQRPVAAGTPTASPKPSATPSPTHGPKPLAFDTHCVNKLGQERVFYANLPGKESPWAVGTALIKGKIHGTYAEAIRVAKEIFKRLCKDERFASSSGAGVDQFHNPFPIMSVREWSNTLALIRTFEDWQHPSLVHLSVEKVRNLWTDLMVPGRTPKLGYQRYGDGPAWFERVWNKLFHTWDYYRVACGGQWTGPRWRLPVVILQRFPPPIPLPTVIFGR